MQNLKNNKPFIKKFIDCGLFYIYDVNNNQIVEVEKPVYDIIDECNENSHGKIILDNKLKGKYSTKILNQKIEEIEQARKCHGLFSTNRPERLTLGILDGENIKKLHSNNPLKQIILELTRDCNLKCKYCNTSGKYFNGSFSNRDMSVETLKRSVDLFMKKTDKKIESNITFYGGEPLLKFDLIKETVAYVKKNYNNRKIRYNLTTNITRLTKEILQFFILNDIHIMVSLDGPEGINDRYRSFKNGKGTFKTIMSRLEFIKQYDADYFSKNVSLSCVIAPPFNRIDDTINFFLTNKVLSGINGDISANFVDDSDTTFFEDFDLMECIKEYPMIDEKFNKRLKHFIKTGDLKKITLEKSTVFSILYNLSRRVKKINYKFIKPLGACHIGLRRIFVGIDGKFSICERSGGNYYIGCLYEGLDYEKIASYYRKLEEVLKDCINCWALHHCERCWVTLGNLNEFKGKKKENFCLVAKQNILNAFKMYTQLLRENPDSLKVFKEVMIA